MTNDAERTSQLGMRLYSRRSERLYLNREERHAFRFAAEHARDDIALLCLILLMTGCRLSEALNIRPQDIQSEEGILAITSLKKRTKHHVREIPVPEFLVQRILARIAERGSRRLFPQNRSTAWRQVKSVMQEACIEGKHGSPKGLRHSFGVYCAFNNVAMPLCQRWMGHADLRTTAIYYQIVGREEREMASRLWE